MSRSMILRNSSGVLPDGTMDIWSRRSLISGSFTTRATSCWMRFTIACGVPAGAWNPVKRRISISGPPASASVGRSGQAGSRFDEVTARPLTLPPFRGPITGRGFGMVNVTCPALTAPAGAHEQRVAVGGGLGDIFGGDDALRTGLVLDDDRLAQSFGHLGRDHAHDDVVAAAGREADDDADRLVGKGALRLRGCRGQCRQNEASEPSNVF